VERKNREKNKSFKPKGESPVQRKPRGDDWTLTRRKVNKPKMTGKNGAKALKLETRCRHRKMSPTPDVFQRVGEKKLVEGIKSWQILGVGFVKQELGGGKGQTLQLLAQGGSKKGWCARRN